MVVKESRIISEKIRRLQNVYDDFVRELNGLRGRRNAIINNILKRIEDKKIQDILSKLKNK